MYGEITRNKRRTVVLLTGFLFILFVLGFVISKATGQPSLFLAIGIGSILYAFITYFAGAKLALAINGAREIQKSDNPRLWRIVENLAITDGLPMPRVYIMDDPAPNAFATGRNYNNAVVAATTGILDLMSDTELEGVMAHELGHVKNYDMRVNTLAFALVGVVSLIADIFLRISFFGGFSNDDNNNNRGGGNGIFIVLAIVVAVLAPISASLLQLAISRRREYLADATGALTTRYPEGLASALEKLKDQGKPLKKQNTATAHMFFVNPLKKGSFMSLFSTHPPLDDRIAKLRGMNLNDSTG